MALFTIYRINHLCLIAAVCLALPWGCGVFGQRDAPARVTSAPSDEAGHARAVIIIQEEPYDPDTREGGIRRMTRLLQRFRKALRTQDFRRASALMARTDQAMNDATPRTRGHPDFEDMEHHVSVARNRLNVAIELDQQNKRTAAIDAWIKRGNATLAAANTMYAAIANGVPTPEDIEQLSELLERFKQLRHKDASFDDEARYETHAQNRNEKEKALMHFRTKTAWHIQAGMQIRQDTDAGYAAARASYKSKDQAQQREHLTQAMHSFRDCIQTINALAKHPLFDATTLIETRLGQRTIADTGKQCVALHKQASTQVTRLTKQSLP